jgi:hypothetical protein
MTSLPEIDWRVIHQVRFFLFREEITDRIARALHLTRVK